MSRSDLVWYGRALVWIGALLLIVMAVTGAQVGYISVVAVLAVGVGVIVLLYTIPWGGSAVSKGSTHSEAITPPQRPESQ